MAQNFHDFKHHLQNPFLTDTLEFIREKSKLIKMSGAEVKLLDSKTGELSAAVPMVFGRKMVDTQEFTKVYINFLEEVFSLKQAAQKVLLYIWKQKKKDEDIIYFSMRECMSHTGFNSKKSVYNGLTELLERKFIAKADSQYRYYINPTMFFNGNRLNIVQEIIKAPKFKELPKPNEENL